MRSSAIFLVSVVTSTRSPTASRARISSSRSSIWPARAAHLDLGVDQAGRADDLLHHPRRVLQLERARRRRDQHGLRHPVHELVEAQRPVVERRRQPEAVPDELLLAAAIALVHAADLRHGVVRLVDEDQEVAREVVEQRERRRARRPPVEDARVVLDAVAVAELPQHLHVVLRALADAVRLQRLAGLLERRDLLLQLGPDLLQRALQRRRRGQVVRRGVDDELVLARRGSRP